MLDVDALSQSLPKQELKAGDILIEEGAHTGKAFILDDGVCAVLQENIPLCVVSERGAPFGELAALLDGKHTATVRAETDARVLVIENFDEFAKTHPETTLHFAKSLASRLANTNRYFVTMQHQFDEVLGSIRQESVSNDKAAYERLKVMWERFGDFMRTEIAPW